MSTRHTQFATLASRSIDGPLGPDERRALDEHLRSCSDCRKLMVDLGAQAEALRGRPRAQVPAGMYARVSTTWAVPTTSMRLPIGALAILMLLLLLSMLAAIGFGTRRLDLSIAQPSPSTLTGQATMDPGRIRSVVEAWSAAHGQPAGSVTVIGRQGEVTVVALDGVEADDPPVGRIGEASRALIATAALALADCSRSPSIGCIYPIAPGTLGLDDPVRRWYPGSSVGDRTVRQLLAGTSGIASIAPTIRALNDVVGADPRGPWDPDSVLARVLSGPVRYAAGVRREPVDSEFLLLEAILGQATAMGAPAWLDMSTITHANLNRTMIGSSARVVVSPGRLASGGTLADLDPTVLTLLGGSGGVATDSTDLARLASVAWGTTLILSPAAASEASDAVNGHRTPLGAAGLCPCTGDVRSVIAQTGHAIAWSSLAAYDLDAQAAIAAVIDTDIADADLNELLSLLVTSTRP